MQPSEMSAFASQNFKRVINEMIGKVKGPRHVTAKSSCIVERHLLVMQLMYIGLTPMLATGSLLGCLQIASYKLIKVWKVQPRPREIHWTE